VNASDLLGLSPLIIPALAGILVMLAGAFRARPAALHALTIGGIGLALLSIPLARSLAPRDLTPLLRLDAYALLFLSLLYATLGILAILARPYLQARRREGEAFPALLLFAGAGMGVMACSNHFASFFLGLETLTVSLYVLLGYLRDDRRSLEAAVKYLILAALASGFLLFGIALVYAATGTLVLDAAARAAAALLLEGPAAEASWAVAGMLMLMVGFGFKLALVPFHMWAPDVYQGAPAPVTALIATGSKGAVVAVLLRVLAPDITGAGRLAPLLAGLAIVTMFAGNLLALLQSDIKRLLAYSSIAHIGYVFVALAAGGADGGRAVVFYMPIYLATTLGAFGIVSVLSAEGRADADDLGAYRGLGRRRPALAATMTVMLLSLAGIPPTGGFLAKFAVLDAAIGAGRWPLALAMVLASGIGLYYYLRVLVVMYMDAEEDAPPLPSPAASPLGSTLALGALVVAVLAIGVYPEPWLRAAGAAVSALLEIV
jgi:NADH-quinone oxidoreductase subunit N